jgi:aminoglycoside 2'-N-acetyltransferase I
VPPDEQGSDTGIEIVAFDQHDPPSGYVMQVARLEATAWPVDTPLHSVAGPLHDPALRPVIMAVVDAGEIVASLALLYKKVRHAGLHFAAVGLSAVTTRTDVRGQGYGHALVTAAHQHVAASPADVGIFTCDRPLQAFYERAGWHVLPGTVLVGGTPEAPFRSDRPGFDKVAMGDFFSPLARAHRAAFLGADVEVYPGEIDRLW